MRTSHGHVEEAHAQRVSQVVGAVGQEVETLYSSKLACTHLYSGKHHDEHSAKDFAKYIKGNITYYY